MRRQRPQKLIPWPLIFCVRVADSPSPAAAGEGAEHRRTILPENLFSFAFIPCIAVLASAMRDERRWG